MVRGKIGLRHDVKKTLLFLNLMKKNNCVVLEDTPVNKGMLEKVKDYITWGSVSDEVIRLLGKRRKIKKATYTLNPPRGGFERKGIKRSFRIGGALGERNSIDPLIKKML